MAILRANDTDLRATEIYIFWLQAKTIFMMTLE